MNTKNVLVKKTGKKGKGVFANRDFDKGESILKIKGKIVTKDELLKSSRYLSDHSGAIGKDKYLIFGLPEKYINHSCNPNVFDKKGVVYAMRDIRKGDELSFDYSINGIDDWRMRCRCESKNCRKIINGDFFALPRKLQEKYLPYLEIWFKRECKKEIKNLSKQ